MRLSLSKTRLGTTYASAGGTLPAGLQGEGRRNTFEDLSKHARVTHTDAATDNDNDGHNERKLRRSREVSYRRKVLLLLVGATFIESIRLPFVRDHIAGNRKKHLRGNRLIVRNRSSVYSRFMCGNKTQTRFGQQQHKKKPINVLFLLVFTSYYFR